MVVQCLLESLDSKDKLPVRLDLDHVMIGRVAGDLSVPDPRCSPRHAMLYETGGKIYVYDLGSREGTFLNERRLEEAAQVRAGDRIRVAGWIVHVIGLTKEKARSVR